MTEAGPDPHQSVIYRPAIHLCTRPAWLSAKEASGAWPRPEREQLPALRASAREGMPPENSLLIIPWDSNKLI